MFSDLIKKEVSKLVLVTFLYTNLSPAFCMQGMPEYVINVERRQNELGKIALAVTAQQLVQNVLVPGALVYKTMVEQVVYPFMQLSTAMTATAVVATAKLYEVLQNVQATVSEGKAETKKAETQLSRGFCLSIPELGDLLISHEGDVVFSGSKTIGKSVKITAPRQVILDGVNAKEMELEAAAAFVTAHHSGKIDSLYFKANHEDDEEMDNALVIDNNAGLEIGELTLKNALLMNSGRLSVKRSMDLQGGMFLNVGSFETAANPATLKNISYFHNGKKAKFNAIGQVILQTGNFSNSGNISARELSLVSSELVDNSGTIETQKKLEIEGLAGILNTGHLNGKTGSISIRGTRFEQKGGLTAFEANFLANESVLTGGTRGQIATFNGKTHNNGLLDFQKGTISGQFVNNSRTAKFAQLLELVGSESTIQSSGTLKAGEIIADSDDATILAASGEVDSEKITVRKNLQVEANLPTLKSITTTTSGKFLLTEKSKTPELKTVENHGESTVLLGATKLMTLQNAPSAQLYMEASEPLARLTNLDYVQGRATLKGTFSAVKNFRVNQNAQIALLPGTKFTQARNFYVGKNALVDLQNESFSNLDGITNDGAMILRGDMYRTELALNGTYEATPGAFLQMESGSKIVARDFNNWGTIQSRYSLDVTQHGQVTRLGDIRSEGDINYSVDGINLLLNNELINPIAKGRLKMNIERDISISDSFETASDLEIRAQNLNIAGRLKAKKLKLQLKDFMLTGYVGTPGDVEVACNNFTNRSGVFEALGNATFNVAGTLTNTGGKKTERRTISFTYYTQMPASCTKTYDHYKNAGPARHQSNYPIEDRGKLSRVRLRLNRASATLDIDGINVSQMGQIRCGKELNLQAGMIQNSFGILNGKHYVGIDSTISNESGIIYSGSDIRMNGWLSNGIQTVPYYKNVNAVDPNNPVTKMESLPVDANWEEKDHFFRSSNYHFDGYIYRSKSVIQKYLPFEDGNVPLPAQLHPGYIFAEGNVSLSTSGTTEFGTIVSGEDIYIGGVQQRRNAHLIAHGNIAMEMQRADLNQIRALATNIVINQLHSFAIGGYIAPVTVSTGQKGVAINVRRLADALGFAVAEAPTLLAYPLQ